MYGREKQQYSCGTLFIDHETGKIFNYCQFSNDAKETISSKHHLEWLAQEEGFQIIGYHADNGVNAYKCFKDDCETQEQTIDFSGVGGQHQNGVTERNIKTTAS